MSLLISIQTELIKTKRSASFWLSFIGAAIIPIIMILMYTLGEGEKRYEHYQKDAWNTHFMEGSQVFAAFLLPMFVILICSLIPQIEYKNNTWKQVFASPQSIGSIFFSKYVAILMMVILMLLSFDVLMVFSAVISNLVYPKYNFFNSKFDISALLIMNGRCFVALLGIIAIQYWLGLRFRNFIVPIGIGLGLLVMSSMAYSWEHVYKLPYAFSMLTFISSEAKQPGLQNHELNSIGYFAFFTLLAFADMRFRKQRG